MSDSDRNRNTPNLGKWATRWLSEVVSAWATAKRATGMAPRTLEGYLYSLGSFATWLAANESASGPVAVTVGYLTRARLRRFLEDERERGLAVSTCNKTVAAVCCLAEWLESRDLFPRSTLDELRTLREGEPCPPPPRFYTKDEYPHFRRFCFEVDPRLWLAFSIAVEAGLRLHEILQLDYEDLVLSTAHPYVRVWRRGGRENKRKRERTPPIPRAFADELLARGFANKRGRIFQVERRRRGVAHTTWEPCDRKDMNNWLREARKRAHVGRDFNFLTARHTFASWHLLYGGAREKITLELIARWMGNSVKTCEQYYIGLLHGGDARAEAGFADVKRDTGTPASGVFAPS